MPVTTIYEEVSTYHFSCNNMVHLMNHLLTMALMLQTIECHRYGNERAADEGDDLLSRYSHHALVHDYLDVGASTHNLRGLRKSSKSKCHHDKVS